MVVLLYKELVGKKIEWVEIPPGDRVSMCFVVGDTFHAVDDGMYDLDITSNADRTIPVYEKVIRMMLAHPGFIVEGKQKGRKFTVTYIFGCKSYTEMEAVCKEFKVPVAALVAVTEHVADLDKVKHSLAAWAKQHRRAGVMATIDGTPIDIYVEAH